MTRDTLRKFFRLSTTALVYALCSAFDHCAIGGSVSDKGNGDEDEEGKEEEEEEEEEEDEEDEDMVGDGDSTSIRKYNSSSSRT